MMLPELHHAHKIISASSNIFIVAGHERLYDSYPAALAFANILQQLNKEVGIFSIEPIPEHLNFLKRETKMEYVIQEQNHPADLIVTIGLERLEFLGKEFERNAKFFLNKPIINIDQSVANMQYGEMNLIDLTASSYSEIVYRVIAAWNEQLITRGVATSLLAGIIAATQNFQNSRTRPSAFHAAADLLAREADRPAIVQHLFKTKTIEFLKLLGTASTKLQHNKTLGMAWLRITREEFLEAGATPKMIPELAEELQGNLSKAICLLIFWDSFAFLRTTNAAYLQLIEQTIGGVKRKNGLLFSFSSQDRDGQENFFSRLSRLMAKNQVE